MGKGKLKIQNQKNLVSKVQEFNYLVRKVLEYIQGERNQKDTKN
jgi:hypothetical protein